MVVHACNTNTWGLRQEDQFEFEVSLLYTMNSTLAKRAILSVFQKESVGREQASCFGC